MLTVLVQTTCCLFLDYFYGLTKRNEYIFLSFNVGFFQCNIKFHSKKWRIKWHQNLCIFLDEVSLKTDYVVTWFDYVIHCTTKALFLLHTEKWNWKRGMATGTNYIILPATLLINTLWTGEADLRLYITTVQDGWRKSAFLTRAWFPRTTHLITQYMEYFSEWSRWRMFIRGLEL